MLPPTTGTAKPKRSRLARESEEVESSSSSQPSSSSSSSSSSPPVSSQEEEREKPSAHKRSRLSSSSLGGVKDKKKRKAKTVKENLVPRPPADPMERLAGAFETLLPQVLTNTTNMVSTPTGTATSTAEDFVKVSG